MDADLVLANAPLVLPDEMVTGSVMVRGGVIAAVDTGAGVPTGALDCAGAMLIPGLIELHTDNLERHLRPRPTVDWPHAAAVVAHDGEMAFAGITTVFDALRVGWFHDGPSAAVLSGHTRAVVSQLSRIKAAAGLRIDHRVHLRADICSQTVLHDMDKFGPEDEIDIVSIMGHTPSQRQFRNIDHYRRHSMGRRYVSAAEVDKFITFAIDLRARVGSANLTGILEHARRLGAVLASHDDSSAEDVAASAAQGMGFAEFPTTLEAAEACQAHGIPVMMGAPNVLRATSHFGNVAAIDLAGRGWLDMLSSDYAPAALLMGAMRLAQATWLAPWPR